LALWFYGGGTRASIPDRFIECDGASLLRAGAFADLFDIIGVQFGSVDGTHFNAPDMDEKFGRGSANANDSGATGGADSVTLTGPQSGIASHTHSYTSPLSVPFGSGGATSTTGQTVNTTGSAGPTSASSSHENRPNFVEGIYIIRF